VSPASSSAIMDWSDKLELVDTIMKGNPDQEEDIDWYNVKASLKHPWPLRTLQTAFKTCVHSVKDQGSLSSTLMLVHTSALMHATNIIDNHNGSANQTDGGVEQEPADLNSPHVTTKRDVDSPKPPSSSPIKYVPADEVDDQDIELPKSPSPSPSPSILPHATTKQDVSQSPPPNSISEYQEKDNEDVELLKSQSPSPPNSIQEDVDEDDEMDWEPPVQETFNTMDYVSESEEIGSEQERSPTTEPSAAKPSRVLDQVRGYEDAESDDGESDQEL